MSQLTIKYSDKLPDAMHLSHKQFKKEARFAMAVKLFEMRKLSSGMAAALAQTDRVSFLLSLADYNVNMINYEAEELLEDVNNA